LPPRPKPSESRARRLMTPPHQLMPPIRRPRRWATKQGRPHHPKVGHPKAAHPKVAHPTVASPDHEVPTPPKIRRLGPPPVSLRGSVGTFLTIIGVAGVLVSLVLAAGALCAAIGVDFTGGIAERLSLVCDAL